MIGNGNECYVVRFHKSEVLDRVRYEMRRSFRTELISDGRLHWDLTSDFDAIGGAFKGQLVTKVVELTVPPPLLDLERERSWFRSLSDTKIEGS